jgi:hypothetical protein
VLLMCRIVPSSFYILLSPKNLPEMSQPKIAATILLIVKKNRLEMTAFHVTVLLLLFFVAPSITSPQFGTLGPPRELLCPVIFPLLSCSQ